MRSWHTFNYESFREKEREREADMKEKETKLFQDAIERQQEHTNSLDAVHLFVLSNGVSKLIIVMPKMHCEDINLQQLLITINFKITKN